MIPFQFPWFNRETRQETFTDAAVALLTENVNSAKASPGSIAALEIALGLLDQLTQTHTGGTHWDIHTRSYRVPPPGAPVFSLSSLQSIVWCPRLVRLQK